RVEVPLLLTRGRIQREHLIAVGTHIQTVVDLQRGVLESVIHPVRRRLVTGLETPDFLQLCNIARIDLRCGGETLAEVGSTVGRPFVITPLRGGTSSCRGRSDGTGWQ